MNTIGIAPAGIAAPSEGAAPAGGADIAGGAAPSGGVDMAGGAAPSGGADMTGGMEQILQKENTSKTGYATSKCEETTKISWEGCKGTLCKYSIILAVGSVDKSCAELCCGPVDIDDDGQ
jgi:hypothetical protein